MMERVRDVTGLILAGGESRRFGSDKARHLVAGRPMIVHVHDVLASIVAEIFVSVRTIEANTGLPVEHFCDPVSDSGPLAGLYAGLLRCRTPWLLAVACDMPFLSAEVLHALLAIRHGKMAPIVARTPDGRRHPLCALYPRTVLPVVEHHLREQRLSLQRLLESSGDVIDVPTPANPLRNINRLQDLDPAEGDVDQAVSP